MGIIGAIAVPHPPLIVPAVGRGDQRRIQSTIDAYKHATSALLDLEPECIVITSPHAPLFRDGFHVTTDAKLEGDMARFRAPSERICATCDVELARAIVANCGEAGIPAVGRDRYHDDMDHATFVPLFFVREEWRRRNPSTTTDVPCPIVRIGLSGLSFETHRTLGRIIARTADALGRKVAFIASGDLSHKLLEEGPYGFAPEGPVFDKRIGEIFATGNLDELFAFDEAFCDAAAECGLRSFQIMAGAIEELEIQSSLLSNEGPFGVGYGVATLLPLADQKNEGSGPAAGAGAEDADSKTASNASVEDADPHVALARLSVETFVRTGRPAALPSQLPEEMTSRRAGTFVSLHEHGQLRGCIGTISATTDSIAEEILQNGISACSRDPRFDPVRPDELDYLEYSVDVLAEAEPISSPDELDVKHYGVIVTKGWKRGLLLPNLDGINSVDEQIAIAKQKAGIRITDNDVQLERFEVVRHTRGGKPRR